MAELENHSSKGDEGSEEFAGEFDARVLGGHASLGHVKGFIAEEVLPEAGAGDAHFDEAGDDGERDIPAGEAAEIEQDEGDADDEVEGEPESGIKRGGIVVDSGVDVVVLEGSENDEEEGEGVIERLHFSSKRQLMIERYRMRASVLSMARKILFVCTGNTCRSPMAEGIFRKAAEGTDLEVSSAGVAAHPGSGASPETITVLREQGLELEGFRSRMVDDEMLEEAEAVFCMTEGHLDMLERMHPGQEEKYHLACDFVEINGRVGVDVPDPIGMGRSAYEMTSKVLNEAVAGIMGYLEAREKGE